MFHLPEWGTQILNALDFVVPGVIVIVSLMFAYSVMKWGKRTIVWTKEVTSTPWGVIVFIAVLAALFSLWFILLRPLFQLGG